VNQRILLGPAGDFVFSWRGCLGLDDRNFGRSRVEGQKLRLTFIYPNQRKGFQRIASELVPVRWGERRSLVPADEMADYCNASIRVRSPERGFMAASCCGETMSG
jgi:hypothetical protein